MKFTEIRYTIFIANWWNRLRFQQEVDPHGNFPHSLNTIHVHENGAQERNIFIFVQLIRVHLSTAHAKDSSPNLFTVTEVLHNHTHSVKTGRWETFSTDERHFFIRLAPWGETSYNKKTSLLSLSLWMCRFKLLDNVFFFVHLCVWTKLPSSKNLCCHQGWTQEERESERRMKEVAEKKNLKMFSFSSWQTSGPVNGSQLWQMHLLLYTWVSASEWRGQLWTNERTVVRDAGQRDSRKQKTKITAAWMPNPKPRFDWLKNVSSFPFTFSRFWE